MRDIQQVHSVNFPPQKDALSGAICCGRATKVRYGMRSTEILPEYRPANYETFPCCLSRIYLQALSLVVATRSNYSVIDHAWNWCRHSTQPRRPHVTRPARPAFHSRWRSQTRVTPREETGGGRNSSSTSRPTESEEQIKTRNWQKAKNTIQARRSTIGAPTGAERDRLRFARSLRAEEQQAQGYRRPTLRKSDRRLSRPPR